MHLINIALGNALLQIPKDLLFHNKHHLFWKDYLNFSFISVS